MDDDRCVRDKRDQPRLAVLARTPSRLLLLGLVLGPRMDAEHLAGCRGATFFLPRPRESRREPHGGRR